MQNNIVICLMGPTSSGKTDLAVDLVSSGGFEIISVDSAQIYKQMDIGTAKPDFATLVKAPHRLLSFIDPAQSYSVAQFCKDVNQEILDIQQNNNIPILVGGTMMYFNALQKGLAKLPNSNLDIRKQLTKEIVNNGLISLHKRLAKIDPKSASKIHHNDTQRIIRALEVYEITKKSISELQQESKNKISYNYLNFAIIPENRKQLHQKIADRFDAMLDDGFVEEVKQLFNRGDLSADLPAMRCVGYRQIWSYLNNEIDSTTMRELAIIATRQLAKRQITWLKGFDNLSIVKTIKELKLQLNI